MTTAAASTARGWSKKRSRAGIVDKADAAQLVPREQLALIFEAGLSTAREVTSISGRGVGMDVVRSNVERIGGIVEVDSKLGEGTRMTLRVPLTLTIIPALTVSIGNQHFAIPRSAIEEIVRANGESRDARASRRRRCRDHPRPPRAGSLACRHPRP